MERPEVAAEARSRASWLDALRIYADPRVARMLLLGFSAGLPLLLVLGTLSYRLREAGIERTTIGFLSWVGLAYAFKWIWAPLVDKLPLPYLTRRFGRRRGWLMAAQVAVALGLVGMAMVDAAQNLPLLVFFALMTAFASATQDISLDAYRIESAGVSQQAALAAAYQVGYRGAMITASAGALWIAAAFDPDEATYQHGPWLIAYACMAAAILAIGLTTVLFSKEPAVTVAPDTAARESGMRDRLEARGIPGARLLAWFYSAAASPFIDFVVRYRWQAVLLLSLIATYRISDIVLGVMANPFYRDMGFTKDEVAAVSGVYGVIMTLVGASLGGLLAVRYGVMRILLLGAVLSAATNLLYAWLATEGHNLPALVLIVSADNLSGGIASAAFVAYLSGLTNVAYSATQYALFSSLMLLLPKFLAGFSGLTVDHYGYPAFFIGTALLGAPVLVLAYLAGRLARK